MRLKFTICFILLFLPCLAFGTEIKDADLSGSWYPDNPAVLSEKIKNYLDDASIPEINGDLIAIISPHAGLQYSGSIAAYGFKLAQKRKIESVIVVGFSHKKNYDGIAIFGQDGIRTPLGELTIDKGLTQKLLENNKKIFTYPGAFEEENSVEMILPFIQASLGKPKIVLLAIGRQTLENCRILGESLVKALKEEKNYLIVASTDMSHYLEYEQAKNIDSQTAKLIEEMDAEKLFLYCYTDNRLCGNASLTATMIAARKLGADKAIILKQENSGDTTADKNRVIGYLSAAFIKEAAQAKKEFKEMSNLLTEQQKKKLLKLARDTISEYLNSGKAQEAKENDPALKQEMGAFVTLRENGQLRGCIGSITAKAPLYLAVRDMAIASAFEDPRFIPLKKNELDKIDIEISVLSPLEKINSADKIILGHHGVLVKEGYQSGVYLPQVATETGWSKEEFMNSLCGQKAGMRQDAWKTGKCEIYVFSAEVFEE